MAMHMVTPQGNLLVQAATWFMREFPFGPVESAFDFAAFAVDKHAKEFSRTYCDWVDAL